ncbi:NGG1p interacting factor NIF3 [Agitococcus lubricus]|uniref:NGG1p interacting factor NIF3 n=1 Tax=Agitococcus lubricus TaxID=1077255 RepID=A0A2T5J2P8_9GAMM|nr:NGG1p interacting factor NIF3 [Agitococcus lubricus]PTQ90803.1 hypothetical protein C8N29_102203 [Agitococcus lubricus]
MYKITFYVPVTHVEKVKNALFAAGAGRIGDYDSCAWQVLGVGQFRPLANAQPFLGQIDQIEQVAEYRVEMVCEAACIEAAIHALKQTHPYQTPAYDVLKMEAF